MGSGLTSDWKRAFTLFVASGALLSCPQNNPAAGPQQADSAQRNTAVPPGLLQLDTLKAQKPAITLRDAAAYCDTSKHASIIFDAGTGETLFGCNEHKPLYPASLTKLMPAFLAFEAMQQGKLKPDDYLHIPEGYKFVQDNGKDDLAKLNLKHGDRLTIAEALRAMFTRSAGDVTDLLAAQLGGTVENCVHMMNERAAFLDMTQTHFTNPTGEHHPDQISTVHDMAVLMQAFKTYFPKESAPFFETKDFSFRNKSYKNHSLLPGSTGGKTGYTRPAGFNLIVFYPYEGHTYIIGTFGGKNPQKRAQYMAQLFELAQQLTPPDSTPCQTEQKDPSILYFDNLNTLQLQKLTVGKQIQEPLSIPRQIPF